MFSSLWECIYSKGFHLLTDLWTAVNLGIRLWFLRVRERSGIKHRVRPSRQCGTKKSAEVSKGQLEDQGWVEWKERDHASARCQASRVGFKLGQAAETRNMPSFIPQTPSRGKYCLNNPSFQPETRDWFSQRINTQYLDTLVIVFMSSKTMKGPQELSLLYNFLPDSTSDLTSLESHIFKSQLSLEALLSLQVDSS